MSLITYEYIKKNKYTRPALLMPFVRAIIIHWTANPGASARNHKIYFGNGGGGRYASAQIFVDLVEALCIIPLNEVAYAANETGKSKIAKFNGNYGYQNGNANGCTINVEMCVEKDGTISEAVKLKTAKVVAFLCKKYNLTEKDVYRHYDVTGKNCPRPFVNDKIFNTFKSNVKKELNGVSVAVSKPAPIKTKAEYFTVLPGSKKIECITNVGIYKTTDFKAENKLVEFYEPGDEIEVKAIVNSKGGTPRYQTKSGHYVTTNKAYVKAVPKPNNVTKSDKPGNTSKYYASDDLKGAYIIIKDCYQYSSVNFDKKYRKDLVKKGEVITVTSIVKSGNVYRLKTKWGFVTANKEFVKKYVEAEKKPHKIKFGDTLGSIAEKNNTTVAALQKLNNIQNVNTIYVGQVIKVK